MNYGLKAKLLLCLMEHFELKYTGVEVHLHVLLTSVLEFLAS
jgi:hypothetical protein